MEIINNAELTRRLLLLENAVMAGKSREVGNTYRSEDADNKVNNTIPQVDENTVGVSDNDIAICDIADLADTNSMAIDDLAELVDELSNRVAELEG